MTECDIEQLLDNWRREGRDRYAQRITPSLEGRYNSESGKTMNDGITIEKNEYGKITIKKESTKKTDTSQPINVKQALLIERIVIRLPFDHKLCLAMQYMYPWSLGNKFKRNCAKNGIKSTRFDAIVSQAKLMIKNNL